MLYKTPCSKSLTHTMESCERWLIPIRARKKKKLFYFCGQGITCRWHSSEMKKLFSLTWVLTWMEAVTSKRQLHFFSKVTCLQKSTTQHFSNGLLSLFSLISFAERLTALLLRKCAKLWYAVEKQGSCNIIMVYNWYCNLVGMAIWYYIYICLEKEAYM